MMKLVCAWCGAAIDRPGYGETPEAKTSHGMCPTCSEALASQERGTSLQQHLDTISIPVLVLDNTNTVAAMNAAACETLGRKSGKTNTPLFGKVFDCIHSGRPEGCGRAIHATGCAIRRSVATTFNTGMTERAIPATRSIQSPDEFSESVLRISTVKMGALVLLRIE